ncbi:MAG: DNA polymerase I [Melioribacteraceae bacterium]|nr:DNA polymerase I [Melioribacteraceae bacterium]
MAKPKETFVIIDAMALAYKGYFAFISRPLSSSKGEPTSAVFGFLNQLFKIIEDTNPDYLVVATDSKEKTFRHEIFDKYKSSRAEMPEDMIPQIGRIRDIVSAFNIPLLIKPGFEADDLIGTAVLMAEKKGLHSYAVTPDKDYVQLITKNTHVIKPGKSTDEIIIIDESKVNELYDFNPSQMVDYLALVGDSSDDIPGVAGIGPKTATPLIKEFGTIENIYKNIDHIEKKGVKNKLLENKVNAFLSKKLATIKTDVPITIHFEEAKFTEPNYELLMEIFRELEFTTFGSKLQKIFSKKKSVFEDIDQNISDPGSFDQSRTDYKLILTEIDAVKLCERLSNAEKFVFDVETNSLDVLTAQLAGIAFSTTANEAYFVALQPESDDQKLFHSDLSGRLSIRKFINIFKDLFENEKIKKICQNGKFDIAVLRTHGINVNGFYFDTMLASYILDADQKHSMDELARKYLDYKPISITTLIGDKKDPEKIFEADLEELSNYSCEDADITFRLFEKFSEKLKYEKLERISYEVEFPLVAVLEDMERTGVKIDTEALFNQSKELEENMISCTAKIYTFAGGEFNINSTKQLQSILFDKLGLQPTKKTKSGYSTDARSLEALKGQSEIIDLLLEYRQVAKLKSTYTDALPKLIHKKTGRLHTSFNQTVTSTGRLSSINPNLQNIPIRTELGREIRKAFIPTNKNYKIFSADYSQIELRIMASICEDPGLMKAFSEGEDIHKSTAALVFQVKPDEVTSDMRRKAKEVNFGILYGIGAFGLKTRLGITQSHAKEIIDNYFNTFKNVKKFMDESIVFARENGYSETLLGRRRYLKNINSNNRVVRQFEERVAINMPIQGTAADMIKIAMIRIHDELNKRKCKTKMILQVHDELIFDAHKDELQELKKVIVSVMENALPLKVPVVVDSGIGDNWLEAH